jgi:hypothetical protein
LHLQIARTNVPVCQIQFRNYIRYRYRYLKKCWTIKHKYRSRIPFTWRLRLRFKASIPIMINA